MGFSNTQFARLAAGLPPHPAWLLPVLAGTGFAAAAALIGLHHPWIGAGALLAGLAAAGLGQASRVLPLGLMTLPFGFGLADPPRALAAMFLMFAMTVLTTLAGSYVSVVIWPVAAAMLLICILPDYFSIVAYLIGMACFVAAGQGLAKGRA